MSTMRAICASAVALAIVASSSADASGCGGRPVVTTKLDDGTTIGVVITEAQFRKAPAWAPNQGEPPLPISKVVATAENWAKNRYKEYDSARIKAIDLT